MDTTWLKLVCSRNDPSRHYLAEPFTVIRGGEPFTVATDGHRIVELPGGCGNPLPKEVPEERILALLEPAPVDASQFDASALADFIRDALLGNERVCEDCANSGFIEYKTARGGKIEFATCPGCKGRCGVETVHVRVGGTLFNARKFIEPLRYLHRVPSAKWYQTNVTGKALIDAGEWRLIVMPLRDESAAGRKYGYIPRFEIEGAEAKAA
jgi:hypothetical protein